MDFTGAHVTRSTVTDLLTMARFGKSENVCIDFTGAFIEDDKPDDIQADADDAESDDIAVELVDVADN